MAQNMEELLGIPTLSGFGVDTGLDMDYLMGGGEDQGENASDLGSSVSDDGDSNDSGEKANKKKSEGTFAVPMKRGISRKGANMGSSIPNQRSSRSSIKLDLIDMERFIKDNPNVEYKIPVLFRSKKGGIRFRMSEILYPRNPKIIEENLEYNYKQMENKLLDLNKEANYENQKKLKDDLKPREENLLKAIRESSIRELLKDYIYLHSDLSLASNYSMIKEKKKQDLKKKQYCRNIPKLKRDFKRSRMLRELDEKKRDEEERKEREEKEKLEKSKAKFTQPSENDIPTITFALRKENLLLTTAERANALNEICKDLNKESLEKDTKKEPINLTSEEQKKFEMKPFRWNIPDLTPEELKDIKRNADTSQLYPKEEESNDQNLKDLTVKYLSNINPTTWAPQVTSNTPNEENKGELDVQMEEKDEDNNSKNEDDDLFMADTNKEQKAIKDDLFEDDPFAEQDPKHDDIDDDFFAEEKDNKNSNAGGGSDEGIFDEKDDKEENKDQNKQAKKDTEKEVVGDFFTEKLKFVHPMEKDSSKDKTPKSFRYFGELQDVDSIYQRKYDNRRNLKKFHKEIKDPVFKSVKSKENTTLVRSLSLEKGRSDDVSNKTLSERMIFNNISMYKFRNKKLDGPLKLGLLTKGKYEMKNSSNKLEKLELASEVDARRKAFKYEYVENMDSQYERDVLRILKKNTSKKENDKYAFEIQDPEKASDKNKSPIIQNTEDYDSKELDEISSIDSDTIEEERKYKVRDGVFGGVSNTLTSSSTTSDLLQHAQCFKFEHFDIENFTRFHRPDLGETFKEISQEKGTNNNNEMSTREKLAMQIAGSNYALENRLRNKILSLPIILSCNRRLKKKLKKTGIRNAYEYFSSRSKLTLKQGKFLVFEHIDQHPLFINNYGMASRLKRYVYSDSLLPLKYFKEPPKGMAQTRHIGYYGQQILLKDDDKLPLIGQIDRKKYQGLAVLENNMYIAPVTYQKPKTTDFVCITHVNNKGKREMHLREMKQIYTVGQLEPKEEVFAPQSRNYNVFLKNRVRAFALRLIQNRPRQKISFYEMRKCFPIFNEQVLKKTLKDSHISVNMDQT